MFQSVASSSDEIALATTVHLGELMQCITPELQACLSLGIIVDDIDDVGPTRLLEVLLSRLTDQVGAC